MLITLTAGRDEGLVPDEGHHQASNVGPGNYAFVNLLSSSGLIFKKTA
jgi:hypothetical protein